MPYTLFIVKATLNDGCRDDVNPNVLTKTFVLRHDTPEQVGEIIRKTLMDIKECGGMFFVKDDLKLKGVENSVFYFNHVFYKVEFETKQITGRYEQNDGGQKQ
jgi:hypothetical protein